MAGPGDNRLPEEVAIQNARVNKWLDLKLQGYTFRKIAQWATDNGDPVSHQYVHSEVKKAIDKIPVENAKELKVQELERLDEMWLESEKMANHQCDGFCEESGCRIEPKEVLAAMTLRLRIMERRAKLAGLDSPVESKTTIEIHQVPEHLLIPEEDD